ncbi:MAG: hypothetical protein ACOYJ7_00075 [Rhodoluna sp.]|nr:hypothetical protein [Microbacteriaceae bacterium]
MTAIRAIQPVRSIAPRRHLRPVPATRTQRSVVPARTASREQARAVLKAVSAKVIAGGIAIVVLNMILSSLANASIYEISQLKKETATLGTQAQIINQQVASLRSPQNLANSAKDLGMVVNSNPVFLSVKQSKVFGAATPASASNSGVSSNLIANAAMYTTSNPANFKASEAAVIDVPTLASVKAEKNVQVQVVLPSEGIPASPTH